MEKSCPKKQQSKISRLRFTPLEMTETDILSLYILTFLSPMSLSHDMIEKITPLSDRVLLKPVDAEKITASGIIIPDSANKERPSLYEVISVGPGRTDKNGIEIKTDLKK